MTSGRVSSGTVFQEIDRESAGFETGDFVEEKLGGLPLNDSLFLLFSGISSYAPSGRTFRLHRVKTKERSAQHELVRQRHRLCFPESGPSIQLEESDRHYSIDLIARIPTNKAVGVPN